MTSAYASQSNRQNSQKSSGPRIQEGEERSRCNALEHGATSRLLVLPGEQAEELEQQRDAWIASRAGEDPIEQAPGGACLRSLAPTRATLRAQQAYETKPLRVLSIATISRTRPATALSQRRAMAGNYETKPLRVLSIATISRTRPATALSQARAMAGIYETKPLRVLSIGTIQPAARLGRADAPRQTRLIALALAIIDRPRSFCLERRVGTIAERWSLRPRQSLARS